MSNNLNNNNNKILKNLNDRLDAENSPEEKTRCQTNLIQVMAVRISYQWQQERIFEKSDQPSGVVLAFQLRDLHCTDIIQIPFRSCTSHKVSPWHKVPFSSEPNRAIMLRDAPVSWVFQLCCSLRRRRFDLGPAFARLLYSWIRTLNRRPCLTSAQRAQCTM